MKKNIIAKVLMVVLLMLGIASSVWAGNGNSKAIGKNEQYCFFIIDVNSGYNSNMQYKEKGTTHAYCNVKNTPIPTNFLVVAKDDTQISNNAIISNSVGGILLRYYSNKHEGLVKLRANSGSTVVKYEVKGYWNANGY